MKYPIVNVCSLARHENHTFNSLYLRKSQILVITLCLHFLLLVYKIHCMCFRLQGVLVNVIADRLSIRKEVMELEGSDRDLAYKIHCKERHLARISLVFSDSVVAGKVSW